MHLRFCPDSLPAYPLSAGTLEVDALPFAATRPEQVVPLYRTDAAFVGAYASRPAWRGSIAADVLPAVGSIPAGAASTTNGRVRLAESADVLMRLRFCPTAVQPQVLADWATSPLPNPFGATSSAAASQQLALALGGSGGAPAAERQAAASDGGGAPTCDARVALPPGTSQEQCQAAKRLLACSESVVLLTELKDARLAPASVSAEVAAVRPAGDFEVTLSSDAVTLFVVPEAERRAGRFNSSALLLLPWSPLALAFVPAAGPSAAAGDGGAAAAAPAMEAMDASGSNDSPTVSVYWLQQALEVLQPAANGTAAAATSGATEKHSSCALALLALLFCMLVWIID